MNKRQMLVRKVSPLQSSKKFVARVLAVPGAGPNSVNFTLEAVLKRGRNGYLQFSKTKDGMKKLDYYLVEFILVDSSGLGLRFEPNPMNAFWVAMGDNANPPPCPPAPAYSDSIYAIEANPNGDSLTIRNDDDLVQFFTFSLGFVDARGKPHRFDPVGSNMNGGS